MHVDRLPVALTLVAFLASGCGGGTNDSPVDAPGGDDSAPPADTRGPDDALANNDTGRFETIASDYFSVTTGAVTPLELCAGGELTISFKITVYGGSGGGAVVELSGPSGSFADPTVLNFESSTSAPDGTVTGVAVIPTDLAESAGYRVRARGVAGVGYGGDPNPNDITIHALPEVDVTFADPFGTPNTRYEVINDTVADSFAWDLGADATPATADVAEPTWRYATPGTKRVSLTATSASGCAVTKTFSAAARVLGCDVAIPASAVVYTADGDLASGTDHWICAGVSVAGGDGLGRVFIEPGARFDYSGGGAYVAIVRAGGTLGGGDRIAVVYEAGADVADLSDEAYACETLDVDLSDAPSPGCP